MYTIAHFVDVNDFDYIPHYELDIIREMYRKMTHKFPWVRASDLRFKISPTMYTHLWNNRILNRRYDTDFTYDLWDVWVKYCGVVIEEDESLYLTIKLVYDSYNPYVVVEEKLEEDRREDMIKRIEWDSISVSNEPYYRCEVPTLSEVLDSICKSKIKKVIFNEPATIVLWNDGTKTVVKCSDNDVWDEEKGLAMAICKKLIGLKEFYKQYDKAIENTSESVDMNVIQEFIKNHMTF